VPQLTGLLKATASGFAEVEGYEMELIRQAAAIDAWFLMPRSSLTQTTTMSRLLLAYPI